MHCRGCLLFFCCAEILCGVKQIQTVPDDFFFLWIGSYLQWLYFNMTKYLFPIHTGICSPWNILYFEVTVSAVCDSLWLPVNMHSQGLRTNCLVLCAEPVGAKAPTFASDTKVLSFVRHTGLGFGLLCQAQGHPVPTFR